MESVFNLKQYTDKFKVNNKQVFSYNTENYNYNKNSRQKHLHLYNSKSLDKNSLEILLRNKKKNIFIHDTDINVPLKNLKNPLKISQVKYSSPIKKGPFDKEKLT